MQSACTSCLAASGLYHVFVQCLGRWRVTGAEKWQTPSRIGGEAPPTQLVHRVAVIQRQRVAGTWEVGARSGDAVTSQMGIDTKIAAVGVLTLTSNSDFLEVEVVDLAWGLWFSWKVWL